MKPYSCPLALLPGLLFRLH